MFPIICILVAFQLAAPATQPADTAGADATASPTRDVSDYNLADGVGLKGYDPVSYFAEGGGEPLKGSPNIAYTFRGVTYRFASEANREKFIARPQRYEPAYGGWCAYAVGKAGKKADVDPKAYLIEEGRLFVFYRTAFNDTRKPWAEDRKTLRDQAERTWQKIAGEKPVIEDFTVTSVGDETPKTFRLSAHRGEYVVLHFLLETRCPICQRYTWEYHKASDELQNVTNVFLKPDAAEAIETWIKGVTGRPTIYRDPEAALAKQLDIPHGYKFHGQVMHYPALVVIDPAGREVFRYVGESNRDRFDAAEFKKRFPQLVRGADEPAASSETQPDVQRVE